MTVYPEDEAAFKQWLDTPVDWDCVGNPITNLRAIQGYRPIPDETTGVINFAVIHSAFLAGRDSTRPKKSKEEQDQEDFEKLKQFQEYIRTAAVKIA
jgi:hypothetical protein